MLNFKESELLEPEYFNNKEHHIEFSQESKTDEPELNIMDTVSLRLGVTQLLILNQDGKIRIFLNDLKVLKTLSKQKKLMTIAHKKAYKRILENCVKYNEKILNSI